MTEKIIENWLIKASEKSYQLPFCYLLMQEGKTVLHMTRHSFMEHGKDILAVDASGAAHAYQLKGLAGGRLTISGWQEIQNQVMQMVLTPCTHPSITSGEYHKSYLVVNGDIEEEVQHAITAINNDWEKRGQSQYKINTIVKGQILDMAFRSKETFMPSEITDFKSLLEFHLEDGNGFLDKEKFSNMLIHLFEEKPHHTNAEFRRLISSAALLCSLATASYTKTSNNHALIEAWAIYMMSVFRTIEKNNLSHKDYENEIGMAQTIISNALKNLFDEVKHREELLYGNLMTDAFVYKARVTILAGLASFLGIITDVDTKEEINTFLDKHANNMGLWGESCVPYFLSVYFFYLHKGEKDKADTFIAEFFQNTMYSIITPGMLFPDIYTDADKATALQFENGVDLPTPRISYILEPLINFLGQPQYRDLIAAQWPEISRCVFAETELDNPTDVYLWRVESAQHTTRYPVPTKSWAELLQEAKQSDTTAIASSLKTFSNWVPLFLMVYPHRLSSNLIKWFMDLIRLNVEPYDSPAGSRS